MVSFAEAVASLTATEIAERSPPDMKEPIVEYLVEQLHRAVVPVGMPEFAPVDLAKLAREIAMDIRELDKVLETYKLSKEQYDWLANHHEFFKQALHVSTIEWSSALTTPERVRLESAAILEDALPRLGARMVNQAEGLPGVVEAAKLFAKLAGLGEKEVGDRSPGEKFQININLGGDDKLVYKSKETPAIEGSTSTVSINTEGSSDTG